MTTQVMPVKVKRISETLAERFQVDQAAFLAVIKNAIMSPRKDSPPPSDEELVLFLSMCQQYNLNPMAKQICAFKGKGGGIQAVVTADGWYSLVAREPDFDYPEWEFEYRNDKIFSCTCTLHRRAWEDDQAVEHPARGAVAVTEFYDECYRPTEPWSSMPHRMMRHKSFIQASRVAYALGGIQDSDEARDSGYSQIDEIAGAAMVTADMPTVEASDKAQPEAREATAATGSSLRERLRGTRVEKGNTESDPQSEPPVADDDGSGLEAPRARQEPTPQAEDSPPSEASPAHSEQGRGDPAPDPPASFEGLDVKEVSMTKKAKTAMAIDCNELARELPAAVFQKILMDIDTHVSMAKLGTLPAAELMDFHRRLKEAPVSA